MGEHTIPSQDALIRAALEVAVDAVCAEAHHLYNDDPKIQRAMLGAIDAIRYLKDDAKAIAAIKAKAEGKP
jgi:tRNA G18 (ribose-2'-O)-methylase SpoU